MDPGVVDVILNIHLPAGESQQPHKSVAQDGIAQMSDVRSFVWVDAGMLDENFTGGSLRPGLHIRCQRFSEFGAIHPRVDVARSCQFQLLKAFN